MPATVKCTACQKEWDEAISGVVNECPEHGMDFMQDLIITEENNVQY